MRGEHVEFIELVFPATAAFGRDEREEIENALHDRLVVEGMGEVSGAGAGLGRLSLDVDIEEAWWYRPDAVRQVILNVLQGFDIPPDSTMRLFPASDEKIQIGRGDR